MQANTFVKSYFDAWNQMDPQSVAGHMSSDGVYWDSAEGVRYSRDELVDSLVEFFNRYRECHELIGDILTSQDTIAFQYRTTLFDSALGVEQVAAYRGAEFVTVHGDSAISITNYYHAPVTWNLTKYARSGLNDDLLMRYKQRLDHLMQSQKLYLEPGLTSRQLAATVGCSVNHLSQVINAGFGSSFLDYLNRYRIQYAQRIMQEPPGQRKAVSNIAFAAGFNSNSAFYAAFRKFVGETPAQHRRKLQKKYQPSRHTPGV